MSNPIDLSSISDEEIADLFSDIEEEHEKIIGGTKTSPSLIMPDPFEKSDFDIYWKDKGHCPDCRDGTEPECLNGVFTCPKCNWRLG